LGDARVLDLEAARSAAVVAAAELAKGQDPREERRRKREEAAHARAAKRAQREVDEGPTVAGLVRGSVESRRLAPATLREYTRLVAGLALDPFGQRKVSTITRADVREYLGRVAHQHRRHIADKCLALLRAAHRWGAGEGLVDRDPTLGLVPLLSKTEKIRRHSLVADQHVPERDAYAALVRWWTASEALPLAVRTFARTLLCLGLRHGEASALRWTDVQDLDVPEDARLVIRAEARKGREGSRRGLVVPLPPLVREALLELRAAGLDSERVFPVSKRVAITVREKTDGVTTLHDLRRSAATGWQRNGERRDIISYALGHHEGGPASDAHYLHGGPLREHRAMLSRWSERILAAVDGGRVLPFEQSA
jgi:integrase